MEQRLRKNTKTGVYTAPYSDEAMSCAREILIDKTKTGSGVPSSRHTPASRIRGTTTAQVEPVVTDNSTTLNKINQVRQKHTRYSGEKSSNLLKDTTLNFELVIEDTIEVRDYGKPGSENAA